jgi:Ca2+-transporting ATPase
MGKGHSQQTQEIIAALETNANLGLTKEQAAERLAIYGPNKRITQKPIRFLDILREEITEPMILLLITVGVLYSIWGEFPDTLTIISIIIVLVLVEVWNEYRAKRSIEALKTFAAPKAVVIRNGYPSEVYTDNLVQGDIILLKVGARVPADARLIDASGLEADESAVTGESFPVAKDSEAVLSEDTRVNAQRNMVFSGTLITQGYAKAVVTATGKDTELSKVTDITITAKEPKTPLQLGMKQLSKTLIWVALLFSIAIPVLSYLRGLQPDPQTAILYGLSLAFVVIPEKLRIIITIILGVGAFALSKKNAIIKKLHTAETLGSTTVIATDKTGIITENKMHIDSFYFDGRLVRKHEFGQNEKEALKTALLATSPIKEVTSESALSNPMAQAILIVVKENCVNLKQLQQFWIFKDKISFDQKRKFGSYIYQLGNSHIALSSGAPENIVANSSKILLQGQETPITEELRSQIMAAISCMARAGHRLMAFSYRRISLSQITDWQNIEQNMVLVGIIGFIDPPRKEVRGAINFCQQAGIKVMMITGDHPETARTIASYVGIRNSKVVTGENIAKMSDDELRKALKDTFVFARTTPEDKLRITRLLRENGEIVAVTGDGNNDAPALKEAHIGIAMGLSGTDVSKETADMVLTDDNFATIATAVREGRKMLANLKKGVSYYLACKVALVASFLLPIALGVPLPFSPIHLIILEVFMGIATSATFVAEPEEECNIKKPPAKIHEKLLNRNMMISLLLGALSLFLAVSTIYLLTWYQTGDITLAQTMAFATWMIGHIFLALNFRSEKQPLQKIGFRSNKLMLLWALIGVGTLIAVTALPQNNPLKLTSLSLSNWIIVVAVSFVAMFWMEIKKRQNR